MSQLSFSSSPVALRWLLWLLLALHIARAQETRSQSLRGLATTTDSSSLPVEYFEEEDMDVESLEEAFAAASWDADAHPPLIPAATAEYRRQEGDMEIVVHEIPVQMVKDGEEDEEWDPWLQLALERGIDLDDYNVTYEGGTADSLEEDHRRNLIRVSGPENNNARFCQYERRRRGIRQVSWSGDLIRQAQQQAAYMARIGRIAHRPNLAAGVWPGWGIITENVCQNVNIGYNGAHRSLMNDVGHRKNILNNRVTKLGIGISRRGRYFYMCQIFKG